MEGEKGSRRQLQTVGLVGMMAIVAVYVGAQRMEDVTMMLSKPTLHQHRFFSFARDHYAAYPAIRGGAGTWCDEACLMACLCLFSIPCRVVFYILAFSFCMILG